jgi:hypothetical protein
MITPTAATRIFVALAPVDLRQSFNGLCAWVQESLRQDPLSGHLFLFTNKHRNRLKALYWDGYGNLEIMGHQLRPGAVFERNDGPASDEVPIITAALWGIVRW